MVTSGSDGPFYWPLDILRDIGTAVSRRTRTGERFSPEQAITLAQAVRMATVNAAYAGFEEAVKGSLTTGRLADMIVVSRDPRSVDPDQIKDIDVDMTIVNGQVAYDRH